MDALSSSASLSDSVKLEEIVINQTTSSAMDRSEVRKSKSKVRNYLKRCKDALYGHPSEETCTITVHENQPCSSSSGTSWYLTEIDANNVDSSSTNKMCSTENLLLKATNQVEEQEKIDNEIKCMSMTQMVPLEVESKVRKLFSFPLPTFLSHTPLLQI